ncbi:hypothetical protein V865_000550 [Kwoniella europaea PYCC6329]|uniref:JmjC domain-containing protein n=1 Tax=Kwoniella europaea PYCC6329 TaxID=1423913 RepID=A0AAX4K826_9TREE
MSSCLHRIKKGGRGISTPFCYVGCWPSWFGWHREDLDLFSLNYCHAGAAKIWWAVPQEQNEAFEKVVRDNESSDVVICPEHMRHKTTIISPEELAKKGIRLNTAIQTEGEWIVTYPTRYHAGYNTGGNVNEAVNYAPDYWVEYGKKAKQCKCFGKTNF